MSTEQKLRILIEEFGLARWKDQILERAKSSIRITPRKVDENTLGLGVSKLGGLPDLPPTVEWAQFKDKSLFFVAQLNLKELHPHDIEGLLPPDGLLSFFVRDEYLHTPSFELSSNGWCVFYFADTEISQLKRTQRPPDIAHMTWLYEPCAVEFAQELTIPEALQGLTIPDADWLKYEELRNKFTFDNQGWATRVLGHADPVQEDALGECEAFLRGSSELVLLLQVDSENDANMMWEDTGRVYFSIRRDMLAQQNFESVCMCIQGC